MHKIIVALDTSPRAADVLEAAIDLARRTSAKLRLFRAVTIPPEFPIERYMNSDQKLTDILLGDAKKDLTELSKKVPPSMLDGFDVRIASPWEGICHEATECDADVIVIGSHGYGTLDRVLGTTASKVVNHADRSVYVVREKPKK